MRLALFAIALALPAASPAEAPASHAVPAAPAAQAASPGSAASLVPSRICRDAMKPRDARSPDSAKLSRLGELPPGDLTLTVVNQIGECMEPVIVRQGIGGFDRGSGR